MKEKISSYAKDLWVVLLDIVAVNASYYLALLIRFFVNGQFRTTVSYLLDDWAKFAPWYTVAAIVIFACFRLYGGMWRYAGLNDMNRIMAACACTTVVMVAGTLIFIRRMPITYYAIGALLQFIFVVLIRFAYRILLVEKKKIASRSISAIPTLVVGSGEPCRKAIKFLEEGAFKPVAILSPRSAGKNLDGIPVIGGEAQEAISRYGIRSVVIADMQKTPEERKQIRELCEKQGIDFQDFTGYLTNLGGKISLATLLEVAEGPVRIEKDGKETTYETGEKALQALTERYEIETIRDLRIRLKKPSEMAAIGYEAWAKQYREQTGEDVSFF